MRSSYSEMRCWSASRLRRRAAEAGAVAACALGVGGEVVPEGGVQFFVTHRRMRGEEHSAHSHCATQARIDACDPVRQRRDAAVEILGHKACIAVAVVAADPRDAEVGQAYVQTAKCCADSV